MTGIKKESPRKSTTVTWQYHQESLQNAYDDIDSLMLTGKHAASLISWIIRGEN